MFETSYVSRRPMRISGFVIDFLEVVNFYKYHNANSIFLRRTASSGFWA